MKSVITSRQNARVREAARLKDRKWRKQSGLFLIDGIREVSRANASGIRIPVVFASEPVTSEAAESLLNRLEATSEVLWASPDVFVKLAYGDRDGGVVAVAEQPNRKLADLQLPTDPLIVVAEGIEKPGNLGAILRTADAAGVDAVVFADCVTDLYNPNTIRASLGTVFSDCICAATAIEVVAWLQTHQVAIVAARPDANKSLFATDLSGATAIVLGSEAEGLSPVWDSEVAQAVSLPMRGIADSLNVSATAAVLLYEAVRQRENTG